MRGRRVAVGSMLILCSTALAVDSPKGAPAAAPQTARAQATPWAFKNGSTEGYSVDLVNITPAPGTYLKSGKMTEFKVDLSYTLTAASRGTITLILENEKNRLLKPADDQVSQEVVSPNGTLALSDFVVVPDDAAELWVYISLAPEGRQNRTQGVIAVRYPIEHAGSTPAHVSHRDFPLVEDYYSPRAKKNDETGTVTVFVCIDANGILTQDVKLVHTSGFAELDRGALALMQAGSGHYVPLQQEGHAVPGCMPLEVKFASH